MSSAVKKFNRAHMEESFEHARELRFQEDIETKPSTEDDVSKTANMFGDFYFTAASASAKEMATKVVNSELQDMRDKLSWGSLTPSKPIPKEEFQNQLSKSKFLSLFLVMRRITGKFQLAQKKKAFKQWTEWLKAFLVLYRSRKHVRRSRSSSPNNRSLNANSSDSYSVSSGYSSRSSHPKNYHFHGDRNMTPEQIRKELYLHKDVYLSSQDDADTARALLHKAHPHTANHPEREYKEAVGHRSPSRHAAVPSHVVVVPRKSPNDKRSRSASPNRHVNISAADLAHNNPNGYHFHGEKNLSPHQLRKELYLHHDMFLTSDDDVANALLHKNRPHSPNHPELAPTSKFASPKNRAKAAKSPARTGPGASSAGVRGGARSQSPPTGRSSPQPGSVGPNGRKFSPHLLRRELHLAHDMFLTSQDDDVTKVMLHKAQRPKGISCRALDVIVGSRKDAQIVHKSDPVSHVKKIASGQHHTSSPSTPRSTTPSKYAAGVTSSGLKAFNISKDKKNDKPRRMSHSPSKVLSAEHAEVVGLQAAAEDNRPGTPSRALTRALSILVTPSSDAVKLDHRVKAEDALKRTLSALSQAGHDDVVEAATRTDSQNDLELSDSGDEAQLSRKNSRIGGLDLGRGLSIRTDISVDGGTVSSTSPSRRNSFRSPTVSHILKVAHRSDSVEKVAAKVAEKRNSTRQLLPKAPHPSQSFEIIPEELVARRAERRTSFRSPTKSHEIKIAEKNGDESAAELITGHTRSDAAPDRVRRNSFADTFDGKSSPRSVSVRDDSVIRTYIPFSQRASSAISPTNSIRSATSPTAASVVSNSANNASAGVAGGESNGKLRRKGSLVPGASPPLPNRKGVPRNNTNTTLTSTTNTNTNTSSTAGTSSRNSSGNNIKRKGSAVKFDEDGSVYDDDDNSSVGVYGVDDDLVNLFDSSKANNHPNNPLRKRGSIVSNNHAPSLVKKATTNTTTTTNPTTNTKYIIQTPRRSVPLQTEARDRKTGALNVMFLRFNAYTERYGKTRNIATAFNTWRVATGWFKRISERVPQSILYLLQVEREILWRVFCVYCQDKQRIPVSPPVLAVTPVLLPEAVERLTTGYSAHHDHHTHAPAVLHPYHDIHTAPVHKALDAKQLKRDLYLHHDIFLNTDDTDVAELEMHRARKHAANHPEEGIVLHHEHVKTEVEVVHHHDSNVVHPHQHKVDQKALQKDIHLKHDIFLSSNDADIIETIVKHNHPHAMNHPEEGVIVDNGRIKRPAKLIIPSPQHSPVPGNKAFFNSAGNSQNPSPVPTTPLYGLFTVIEDDHDNHDEDGASPPPKLNYGIGIADSDSPSLHPLQSEPEPEDHISPTLSPNPSNHTTNITTTSTTTTHTITHTTHTTTTSLEILVPSITNVTKSTPAEVVAKHASTRFKKKLMDVDGLWQLFLDFNVVPYLFNKVQLREMFDHSVSTAPLSPDNTVVVWENNPLQHLPAFNVYTKDAPELVPDAPWSPVVSPRVSPARARSGSVNSGAGGVVSGVSNSHVTPNRSTTPNNTHITPNTKTTTPNTGTTTPNATPATTTTTPTTASADRRPSAVSTGTTGSASQRRMNRMLDTLSVNGTRRAFTSPDGKVQIKLTAFSPPTSIVNNETYIGNVTNPRSKSPAVVRAHQLKKKQEDDFAKAIVSANRKAAEEKALAEKNARRASASKALIKSPAMYKSVLNVENQRNGRATSPKRSPNKPVTGAFNEVFSTSLALGEMDLFRVDLSSPNKVSEMISFHSFIRLLWVVAASYMEIEKDDEAGIAALKGFVFVLHRYHARMVTKEVEKVLPLLAHDQNIRHKALKLL